jgi:predicted nucleic acid-binding protein
VSSVFADTAYLIGLISKDDSLHSDALEYAALIEADPRVQLVTTDAVLVKLLNGVARHGQAARESGLNLVRILQQGARIEPQTRELLSDAMRLYSERPDKDWSLTDCISLLVMDRLGIDEALSPDQCFVQAGKKALLRKE